MREKTNSIQFITCELWLKVWLYLPVSHSYRESFNLNGIFRQASRDYFIITGKCKLTLKGKDRSIIKEVLSFLPFLFPFLPSLLVLMGFLFPGSHSGVPAVPWEPYEALSGRVIMAFQHHLFRLQVSIKSHHVITVHILNYAANVPKGISWRPLLHNLSIWHLIKSFLKNKLYSIQLKL